MANFEELNTEGYIHCDPLKISLRTPTERDWLEDWEHENGQYQSTCGQCKEDFIGHKRRCVCKRCTIRFWLSQNLRYADMLAVTRDIEITDYRLPTHRAHITHRIDGTWDVEGVDGEYETALDAFEALQKSFAGLPKAQQR